MKKIFKIILGIIIFIISFICVDGLCARFFKTRPIIAKKEKVYNEITDVGVVYRSIFADVYYCDTIIELYNDKGYMNLEKEVKRYYQKKDIDFVCDVYISEMGEFSEEVSDFEYMSLKVEAIYKAGYNSEGYNKKLNVFTENFLGYYAVNEQWMGEQKYTEEDCKVNSDDNGIYVFRVNGINDYTKIGYYSDKRNEYINEYKESYFLIYKILDDENIIIKYTVTNNKHEEPYKVVYYKWNIINDTLTEWQV